MIIFHNPRCRKSRETLQLLQDKGLEPTVVEYLLTPPNAAELSDILHKLNLKPEELVRKTEAVYKEQFKGKTLTDEQWIQALVENPKLIERPIVVNGEKAAIGRPAENVLEII